MLERLVGSVPRPVRSAARTAAARTIGVPLPEHATAAQDDRPTPAVLREIATLRARNLTARAAVVDPRAEVVVTMTTHGERIRLAWVALESIARGASLPRRLVLFLDEHERGARLPAPLRRLQRRGLEILPAVPGLGVHAKYWPHVTAEARHALPLVVADDDMLYPERWLASLVAAHRARPGLVHAFRAHRIPCERGRLAPYRTWAPVVGTEASFANFGTGVSGQLLPTALLDQLHAEGDGFRERAPAADDIWINAVAVRAGIRTAQVEEHAHNFPFVPGTQATGLYRSNVAGGENDRQLASALTPAEVSRICAAHRSRPSPDAAPLFVAWGRFTDNPWQDIVEAALRDAGFESIDLDHGGSLSSVLSRAGSGLVVHFNWTAPITQRAGTEAEALVGVDRVLAQIDELREAGGALIWTVHNAAPHEQRHTSAERRLLEGLAARADAVHTMHPRTAEALAERWGVRIEREANIPHPSYLGWYPDRIRRAEARAALGVAPDRTVVLLHGALRAYKGIDALVEAFIVAAGQRDDLHLLVAGRPGEAFDPIELAPLEGRADASIHAAHVPVDEVQRWHRAADALVMPYRGGLNSGALQLAATFDLPVVAFPCLAVDEAARDGWVSVVDPQSPEWLLDGLRELPPDASARARAWAQRHAPSRVGAAFGELALGLLGERPPLPSQ